MKNIEMTKDEANFISEVLGLFRKLSHEQQKGLLIELASLANEV